MKVLIAILNFLRIIKHGKYVWMAGDPDGIRGTSRWEVIEMSEGTLTLQLPSLTRPLGTCYKTIVRKNDRRFLSGVIGY